MEPCEGGVVGSSEKRVNGKPITAHGELTLYFAPETSTNIDKVIGIVKKDNTVLKFRIIIEGNCQRKDAALEMKLIYLGEEPIDCNLKVRTKVGTYSKENPSGSNDEFGIIEDNTMANLSTFSRKFTLTNTSWGPGFYLNFVFEIGQDADDLKYADMKGNYAHLFNDHNTSDFKVICKDTYFHVHQWILQQESEYFSALLRNECVENQNKELRIEDFEPKTVELLLKYLYNGTIECLGKRKITDLMRIADKYNFTELFRTCDSYLAQWYAYMLDLCCATPRLQNSSILNWV